MPVHIAVFLCERLLVVPVLDVEQALTLAHATDVDDRHREDRDEHVRVLATHQHFFAKGDLRELEESPWTNRPTAHKIEILASLFEAEEIFTHDLSRPQIL